MNKIRKGDQVVVISGRDKGRKGAVLRIVDAEHVVVESVNRVKRHTRPNPQANVQGGIIEKADRVGVKTLADGKRVRFFKSNGEVVDV